MIKTPLSTVIGGAFWTPEATVIGGGALNFEKLVAKLFANNEQGFFYDPNDLSTMFQDSAGTVPVTGAGQSVGLILDKSGRNNHAFQANSASRPILRKNAITGANYLEFDGSDDFLRTNNIDFTATDKVSLFVGVNNLSSTLAAKLIAELSTNSITTQGTFAIFHGYSSSQAYAVRSHGTIWLDIIYNKSAPDLCVMGFKSSISAPKLEMRHNGSVVASSLASQGTGNYSNSPLYIGRRGGTTIPFTGHIYSLIGVGKLTSNDETIAIEKEIAKQLGVTLNV